MHVSIYFQQTWEKSRTFNDAKVSEISETTNLLEYYSLKKLFSNNGIMFMLTPKVWSFYTFWAEKNISLPRKR